MVHVNRILQPNQGLSFDMIRDNILSIPAESEDELAITLLTAYATWSGIRALTPSIRALREAAPSVSIRAIIGSNGDKLTTREALNLLLDICDEVVMVALSGDTFHPKGFLREGGKHAVLIEGSPNLTEPALFRNTEWVAMSSFDLTDDTDVSVWNQVTAMVESSIDPNLPEHAPVGLGSLENTEGGVWIVKSNGQINEQIRDSIMPRLQSEDVARRVNTRNRRSRGQGGSNRWGAPRRPRIGVPSTTLNRDDYGWQPPHTASVSGQLHNSDTAFDTLNIIGMVEQVVLELRLPNTERNDVLIFSLMNTVLSLLNPTVEQLVNTSPATSITIGAWKRLSGSDMNHSTEIQSFPNVMRNLTRQPPYAPDENLVDIQYLGRNLTVPQRAQNFSRIYRPTSGHQGPRLAHRTAAAFEGAHENDILVIIPIKELDSANRLTDEIDSLVDSDPDCIAIILPSTSPQGERILSMAGGIAQGSGYLSLD